MQPNDRLPNELLLTWVSRPELVGCMLSELLGKQPEDSRDPIRYFFQPQNFSLIEFPPLIVASSCGGGHTDNIAVEMGKQ